MNAVDNIKHLFERLSAGDRVAIDEVCRRYGERVTKIVRGAMGGALRKKLETVDIVQETMIVIIGSAGGRHFESEHAFLAWIRAVVERRILRAARYWRAARRRSQQELASGEAICELPDPRMRRPSALVMLNEEAGRISAHIAELRRCDREVITCRALLGLPWAMVAARLGVTEETAQMRFNRARRRLADLDASKTPRGRSALSVS